MGELRCCLVFIEGSAKRSRSETAFIGQSSNQFLRSVMKKRRKKRNGSWRFNRNVFENESAHELCPTNEAAFPMRNIIRRVLSYLGPGLITGASDDDPSGIGTYSQVGAQFGYGMLWTLLFSFLPMAAIQEISARIGRVTGHGIAKNMRRHLPKGLFYGTVFVLFVANTINVGADIGAIGAAVQLLVRGSRIFYVVLFAVGSIVLEVFVPYRQYVRYLKWLTLALFTYVLASFSVGNISWAAVARYTFWPSAMAKHSFLTALVAVLGTTISPYLFFWQASEEAEEVACRQESKPLKHAADQAPAHLRRIRIDTYVGMGISNVVAFFIVLTTAATLHAQGITDIQTAEQAASVLRPLVGRFSSVLFTLGIVGTGLLAIPVLVGSAAYAAGEAFGWKASLELTPRRGRHFYSVMALSTFIGILLNLVRISPMKALYWTAVLNGAVAGPILVVIMMIARDRRIMGNFTLPRYLTIMGWTTTGLMLVCLIGLFLPSP